MAYLTIDEINADPALKPPLSLLYPLGSIYSSYDVFNKFTTVFQVMDYDLKKQQLILLAISSEAPINKRKKITIKNANKNLTRIFETYIIKGKKRHGYLPTYDRVPYVMDRIIFNEQVIEEVNVITQEVNPITEVLGLTEDDVEELF